MLDELLASGEVLWSGVGALSTADGWVAFHPAETAPLSLAAPGEVEMTDVHHVLLDALSGGGAYFFRQLSVDGVSSESLKEALWQLICLLHPRLPSLTVVVDVLFQWRITRWLLWAGWFWWGWHVWVRGGW